MRIFSSDMAIDCCDEGLRVEGKGDYGRDKRIWKTDFRGTRKRADGQPSPNRGELEKRGVMGYAIGGALVRRCPKKGKKDLASKKLGW